MDKASVIGAAIEYMEHLQDRVRTLEELQTANQTTESTVVVKQSRADEFGDSSSNDESRLPEIKARVCDNNILLKIQCLKSKGLLGKILGEVDKLDLLVVNIAVTQLGSLAFDITIITQMEKEFRHSTKEIVTALRLAVQANAEDEK